MEQLKARSSVAVGDPTLDDLVRAFEEAEDSSDAARLESEKARDYYDGRQLTSDQITALKKRKQPIVIENLIRPKVDYLCGLERQTRTDPKAYPRTAMHDEDANAVTDALRYVADDQKLDVKRSRVFQHMLIEGFGGVEVGIKQGRKGLDITLKSLDWDRLFYDPHSCKPDFSDAMYMGYVTWMDLSEAKRMWPDKVEVLESSYSRNHSAHYETYDDKPKFANWADPARNRVRIVTIYDRRSGEWQTGTFTLSGQLDELSPSEYLDEDGKPECAIILASAFVDRDNDRYGLVRDFLTLQDEVNKRRMKFLHLSNTRQVRVSPATSQDPNAIRRELARPDGVIIGEQGDVEIIGTGDMAAGHFNLLAEAKEAINAVGPNATMQGKGSESQSGRAILAMQQGGMTEVAPLLDALRDFNIRVFRAMWNRIRQFWTQERWVRVTDDEQSVRFVGLNTSKGQIAAMKLQDAVKSGKVPQEQAQVLAQQLMMDPRSMEPANTIAELDVDILIDEQMDAPTLQMEQFNELSKIIPSLIQTRPDRAPQLLEVMVEASSLRDKDKIRAILEEQPQQPDPMQQMAAQIAMAKEQAEVEKTQSEAAENYANAQRNEAEALKTGVEIGVAA